MTQLNENNRQCFGRHCRDGLAKNRGTNWNLPFGFDGAVRGATESCSDWIKMYGLLMHVLIIEDRYDSTSGLSIFLEATRHVVDTAGSGISCRHLALVGQYDVIVLHVILPETDGIGLCRKLRDEECNATPILMISMCDSLDEKIACMEAGADDYLVHPVTLSEFESRLRVLFRLSSHARVSANY
jgi:CheY-like chemotaxis protein